MGCALFLLLAIFSYTVFWIGNLVISGFFKFRKAEVWHRDEKRILYDRISGNFQISIGGKIEKILYCDLKDAAMRYNDAYVTIIYAAENGQVSQVITSKAFRKNILFDDKNAVFKKSWLQKAILDLKLTPADNYSEIRFFQSIINQIANQEESIPLREMFPQIRWPW